ncbi:hypothetical protein CTA2_11069 [Colletotrichum tanaceti]|uniref:MYND-type domain-containing protein n=1 Tax=Colletotrichum tanaceti TaxID=1306861 RepID=A0A4U6XHT3_9PEZI|nr:hypothetical protein CTA2_11069 [Colletotrichum tanaceti]TKW55311.1 hypothetical protein CTA1_12783 [Colletotrichum tanaceti]
MIPHVRLTPRRHRHFPLTTNTFPTNIEYQNTAMANPSTAKEDDDWAVIRFTDTWHFPTCNSISPFNRAISRPYDPAIDRWCLLAEVIDDAFFFRARVIARDREGKEFVVGFYPSNADAGKLNLAQFHVGYTIALVYPKPHKFLDGRWGVRVDDLDFCSVSLPLLSQRLLARVLLTAVCAKLFTFSLNDVLRINSDLCTYIGAKGTPRKCHACGKHDAKLVTCSLCQLYSYCNSVSNYGGLLCSRLRPP